MVWVPSAKSNGDIEKVKFYEEKCKLQSETISARNRLAGIHLLLERFSITSWRWFSRHFLRLPAAACRFYVTVGIFAFAVYVKFFFFYIRSCLRKKKVSKTIFRYVKGGRIKFHGYRVQNWLLAAIFFMNSLWLCWPTKQLNRNCQNLSGKDFHFI